ncbi:hypothetical protein EON67_09440 [archaeon]|nr:MAG: hypothetical protein EON67_09440 [archaeon]
MRARLCAARSPIRLGVCDVTCLRAVASRVLQSAGARYAAVSLLAGVLVGCPACVCRAHACAVCTHARARARARMRCVCMCVDMQ